MNAPGCSISGCLGFLLALLLVLLATLGAAQAMQPPEPGMIDQMKAEGTYNDALAFAEKLGNHKMKAARRGMPLSTDNPQGIADLISANLGKRLDDKSGKSVSEMSPRELTWVELDLNHDGVVDERDVLALGQERPKVTASFPSLGTVKAFCLLIDFSDYPSWFAKSVFETNLFGDGDTYYYYRGLKYYYTQASYSQLTVDGSVYGWYRAEHPRTYYHPNNSNTYPDQDIKQSELVEEAINAADAAGADFSQFDNDGDGKVDYFLVIWTGPRGAWSSFWWGYYGVTLPDNYVKDGVIFSNYSWQWEQGYDFGNSPPNGAHWDPYVTIHETGHALGLPDYYDYTNNDGANPNGGVGRLDQMDGNWGDHNCFSKYVLGWLTPTIAFTNLNDEAMQQSFATGDPVISMQGFDPVSPWSEYFITQNRYRGGIDPRNSDSAGHTPYPADGLLIWHVDARVKRDGDFEYNNSSTAHKLLRLMEADGEEDIEANRGADAGDYYDTGESLSPTSTPNSNKYDGGSSSLTINDISADGSSQSADFTLYSGSAPTVSIDAPSSGATVSGNTTVTVSATGGGTISKVQLVIDGLLVKEWTSWTSPQNYTWNTALDFNGTRSIVARAWGDGSQVGSATISVTVSNSGATSISENFNSGLDNWRIINLAADPRGQQTVWDTRTSPANPTPKLSENNEAWVKPADSTNYFRAADILRSQRINASGFSRPLQVKFVYRTTGNFSLWATTDNGASWTRLESIMASNGWFTYSRIFSSLAGQTLYLALRYEGYFSQADSNGRSANIDSFVVREVPSNAPTVSFSSPSNGSTVSGSTIFTVSASDDGSVSKVDFYVNGNYAATDSSGPSWTYTRDTRNDDDHPGIPVKAIAEDNDGIPSNPAQITVVFNNDRPYPVIDDLESGSGNWQFQNDGKQPQWQLVTTSGHSGSKCIGLVPSGGWEAWNNDGAWYKGDPPTAGYQTIDLSNVNVNDPVLRFWYKIDMPNYDPANDFSRLQVLWYDTWVFWQYLGTFTADATSWTEMTLPLPNFAGYSGRIAFWYSNGTTTSGATGIWIDDIRVENRGPAITAISPNRGTVATEVTISGSGFGAARGSNYVTFGGGVQPQVADYVSWSNNSIHVKIPSGAQTGNVTASIGGQTSNGVNCKVILGPPSLGGLGQL